MEKQFIYATNCDNNEFNRIIEDSKKKGLKYYVKCVDSFFSGWGEARGKKHIQIDLCYTNEQVEKVIDYCKRNGDKYIRKGNINDLSKSIVKGKSFTIREYTINMVMMESDAYLQIKNLVNTLGGFREKDIFEHALFIEALDNNICKVVSAEYGTNNYFYVDISKKRFG